MKFFTLFLNDTDHDGLSTGIGTVSSVPAPTGSSTSVGTYASSVVAPLSATVSSLRGFFLLCQDFSSAELFSDISSSSSTTSGVAFSDGLPSRCMSHAIALACSGVLPSEIRSRIFFLTESGVASLAAAEPVVTSGSVSLFATARTRLFAPCATRESSRADPFMIGMSCFKRR